MLHCSFRCCLKVTATASVLIELDASFSSSESLRLSERSSWNILLLMVSQSNAIWSLCTTLLGMKILGHHNWPLSECSLLSTSTLNKSAKPQNSWTCDLQCPVQGTSTCTTLFHLWKVVEHFVNYLLQLWRESLLFVHLHDLNYHMHTHKISRKNSHDFH